MEQNSLKKLKRNELLEIIVRQKKHIEELEEKIDKLEHAEDQDLHLSFSDAGSWSDTLRKLADLFEYGEKACVSAAGGDAASGVTGAAPNAVPSRPAVHEEFDWKTSPQSSKDAVPAKDASFIDLEDIKWPSNR